MSATTRETVVTADPALPTIEMGREFHDVVPNERITQTFTFEGFPEGVSLETTWFEAAGDGRTRVRTLSVVDSIEARDAMIFSGMEGGVREGYEKMDALLETL